MMRNNSADMARHAMCASPSRRVCITFTRVRPDNHHHHHQHHDNHHGPPPLNQAMTLWQPGSPNPAAPMDATPKWGLIRAPLVMLAPVRPVVMNPRSRVPPHGGTGVFLPWAVGSRKPAKHLPPRAQRQRGRFLSLPPVQTQVSDTMSDPGVEGSMM